MTVRGLFRVGYEPAPPACDRPGYNPSLFVATHHVAGSQASLFGFFDGLGTRGRALRYDAGLLTLLANDAQVTTGEPVFVGTAIVSGGYPPSWSDDPSRVWARIDGRVLSPSARGTPGLSPAVARISIGSPDSDMTFDVAEVIAYLTGMPDDARASRLEALLSRYRP